MYFKALRYLAILNTHYMVFSVVIVSCQFEVKKNKLNKGQYFNIFEDFSRI